MKQAGVPGTTTRVAGLMGPGRRGKRHFHVKVTLPSRSASGSL